MSLRSAVKNGFALVSASERELARLPKRTLEDVLEEHMLLLLSSAGLAAVVSLLFSMLRGAYYHLVRSATVDYLALLNFSTSIAAGIFFLYLFVATFGLGLLGFVLAGVLRLRYVDAVKLLCASFVPVFLFGWFASRVALALLVWSLVLLAIGVRAAKR